MKVVSPTVPTSAETPNSLVMPAAPVEYPDTTMVTWAIPISYRSYDGSSSESADGHDQERQLCGDGRTMLLSVEASMTSA